MREIAIGLICFTGLLVFGFWALTITLAIKSGKGFLSLFTRKRHDQWLSAEDTIAQYGDDHTFPAD